MRILVVNKFFWPKGGSERVMFDLLEGYEAAGHETVHFSMRSARNRESPWADHFVSEVGWEGGGFGGRLRAAARAVWSREAASAIRVLVRETRPDVAHLHNFHHQLSPSIVDALRAEGAGCVHTLHDYKVICPNYLLYTEGEVCERCRGGRYHEAVLHRCLKEAVAPSVVAALEMTVQRLRGTLLKGIRTFVSPSRFLRRKLEEFGWPVDRIRVVPNGLDPARFEPAGGPGTGFLYAGRLSREKGLPTLLRAVERVPEARLVVAGTGPSEEELRGSAGDRVEFVGHLERSELLKRIRSARAVILPSEWYENAPIAALEALACGVPVVASRIGGNPEIVRDGENGLVFEPGDSEGLAERLASLAADPALAHRLGGRGREIVEREYSLSAQVEGMLAILEEVASSGSR
jgi:glycosyltransferase involved in cell wall biosynthesis